VLNDLLRGLAPVLSQDRVILFIVMALVVWAALSAYGLVQAGRNLRDAFGGAARLVGRSPDEVAFAASYASVSAGFADSPLLGRSWRAFRQSLIVPLVPGRPVATTSDPRQWFDLPDLFRQAGTDLRYHAALPGLLVGAGLLFTFLGLACALAAVGGVVAEGVSQAERNAALRDLLGAASVKFVTSLAGLFLSIAYALLRKRQLRAVEVADAAFVAVLRDRMPLRTPAALQAEGNAVLEKQYADVQRIGGDFFVNLGSTLEREFGQGLRQHVGPLAEAIEKLASRLSNQTEDVMQAMLASFLERLEGAVGDSMRGTSASLEALGARLGGLQDGMDAAAQRMGRAAEEMAAGMGRGTELALGGITEQMGALVHTLREAAEAASRSNRAAGDDLARQTTEAAAALTNAVALFQQRLENGAAEGVGRLAAPIEALLQHLRELSDGQRQAGADSTAALAMTIARSAAALEATAAKVAEVLGGGAADASGRLVAATEAMRNDLRHVLEQFGAMLGKSGAILEHGAAAGGETLRGAAAALVADLGAAADRLRGAGEAAGAALRDGGSQAGSGLTEAARTLVQGSAGLADRMAALGVGAAALAERTTALNQAMHAAAAPLAGGAADLRSAGEAARNAAEPLREVAQALRGALDGLAGAAAALEAAQRGSDQRAIRFGTATDRFEGLDRSLGDTLRKLTEGLNGFRSSVTTFVTDIDQGLKHSVEGLAAVASSLEESANELSEAQRPKRGLVRNA